MPFKGETKITFPQDNIRNVMVVFGDNMRGKTSLLNAVRWAFYGRALGRHLREIPLHDLHNRAAAIENDWVMECRIEFEAEGSRYDLRRRATKKAIVATPSRPEDFEIAESLQKDGAAISGYLVESEINRFVPEQISRFFLFDGELLQEYESLLIEGSDQGKRIKDSIEQVLGVPTLIHGRDEIYTILKSAQKSQSKDLAQIQVLKVQADKQEKQQAFQDSFEKDLINLKLKLESTKNDRTKLDDELEKVDAIHQAKLKLDTLIARQSVIDTTQKNLSNEKLLLLKDAWKDLLTPQLSIKRAELLLLQDEITNDFDEKRKIHLRIVELRKNVETSSCGSCGQPLIDNKREKAIIELAELEAQQLASKENSYSLNDISNQIQEINSLMRTNAAGAIKNIDAELRKLSVELTKVENDIEEKTEEIRGSDPADIARKRNLRDSLIKDEALIDRDINDRTNKIEDTRKELAIIAKALESYPEAKSSRSTALVNLSTALGNVFKESIEKLRDNLRKHVEEKASETFLQLTTQKKYNGLEINENYGLTILDDNNQAVNIRSAGAEQIVALSLIDGLARTGRAEGPVVMDTPFGRLDLKHRDNILSHLPTTTSQLILLVHDGEINRQNGLALIASRIGAAYEIKEVNSRHSKIEKIIS